MIPTWFIELKNYALSRQWIIQENSCIPNGDTRMYLRKGEVDICFLSHGTAAKPETSIFEVIFLDPQGMVTGFYYQSKEGKFYFTHTLRASIREITKELLVTEVQNRLN